MKCFECEKEIIGEPIRQLPNRHICSPLSIGQLRRISGSKSGLQENDYDHFCSEKCQKELNLKRYAWFAALDRNASDSECFEHISWAKDRLGRMIRFGRCKITGKEYEVEPSQPGDNSGQPKECYDHFKLRENYLNHLTSFFKNYFCKKNF